MYILNGQIIMFGVTYKMPLYADPRDSSGNTNGTKHNTFVTGKTTSTTTKPLLPWLPLPDSMKFPEISRVGLGVRIDPLRLLAGCRKTRQNQAPLNLRSLILAASAWRAHEASSYY